jgi:hypothetical protein
MPLYKVWNSTRDVKKPVIACSLAEFASKVMLITLEYMKIGLTIASIKRNGIAKQYKLQN